MSRKPEWRSRRRIISWERREIFWALRLHIDRCENFNKNIRSVASVFVNREERWWKVSVANLHKSRRIIVSAAMNPLGDVGDTCRVQMSGAALSGSQITLSGCQYSHFSLGQLAERHSTQKGLWGTKTADRYGIVRAGAWREALRAPQMTSHMSALVDT